MSDKSKVWSSNASVKLSLAISWFCAAILVFCMVAAPFLLPWWYTRSGNPAMATTVMTAFYICCPMGIGCVVCLIKLLSNINNGIVFDQRNILLMRILSWCCFLVAIVTVASMFVYPPFFFVFCASGFLGLILRVVKNVIAKATELKAENDLTI